MYQQILVPVDGSAVSNRGLDEAVAVARLTGGRLRLIHVVDELSFALNAGSMPGLSGDLLGSLRDAGREVLNQCTARVEAAGVAVDAVLRDSLAGRLCEQVVQEATDWGAQLIVIGTHGRRGAGRLFMGSDAEQILRLAPVPVLLVRDAAAH